MRILYVTTIGATMGFFKSFIQEMIEKGNTVDIATNEDTSKVPDYYRQLGCKVFHISCSRSPFSFGNFKAIDEIWDVVVNGHYDIVHCHTPIAAFVTRLACKDLRTNGLRVIYTAHGFHFFKGAPLKNWLVFYPLEWLSSFWTDVLITINKEDYERAKKDFFAKKVAYVPGVGIDVQKFANTKVDIAKKREELGIPTDSFLILSVGELNENKNHKTVIQALSEMEDSNIHYMIAGEGPLKENLIKLAQEKNVNLHLLGFRKDVAELYKTADLFIHPSFREGLPVSVMEALASGLEIIGSDIRGNRDLINQENLFSPKNVDSIKTKIFINVENYFDSSFFDKKKVNRVLNELYEKNQVF